MNAPDMGFEQVELATGNEIVGYYDQANDQAVVFAFLREGDNTVSAVTTLACTTVERAQALIQAFRDLGANGITTPPDNDQIIVAVRCGLDESARWRLQPEESSWQIAQIAEDLEDHLAGLIEADDQRKDHL